MNPKDFVAVIGPLSSHWGMRTWRLLLGHREILCWPYSSSEAPRLAWSVETGLVTDAGTLFETGNWDELQKALLGPNLRRYLVQEVASITLHNRMSCNRIKIDRMSGTADQYGILYRRQTEAYRELLRKLYPLYYREEGFPKTWLGRILKS
jgi:hypothetical protein